MLNPDIARRLTRALLVVTGLGLATGAGASRSWRAAPAHDAPRRAPAPADWRPPDLAEHLRARGLALRVVPPMKGGPVDVAAFLTETAHTWEQLNQLHRAYSHRHRWAGTVQCVRGQADEFDCALSPDRCLVAGPFFLFGDPDLLRRIAEALR
jgi:hypothetical protein